MNKVKQKIIFSWIALTGGIFSFVYMTYGTLCILYLVDDKFMLDIGLLLSVAILALVSGILGLFGKVNRGIRVRSLVGAISGFLFCVAFFIWCAYLIEW